LIYNQYTLFYFLKFIKSRLFILSIIDLNLKLLLMMKIIQKFYIIGILRLITKWVKKMIRIRIKIRRNRRLFIFVTLIRLFMPYLHGLL